MAEVAESGPAEPQARHVLYCGGEFCMLEPWNSYIAFVLMLQALPLDNMAKFILLGYSLQFTAGGIVFLFPSCAMPYMYRISGHEQSRYSMDGGVPVPVADLARIWGDHSIVNSVEWSKNARNG